MNTQSIVTHGCVALLAFGLGWLTTSNQASMPTGNPSTSAGEPRLSAVRISSDDPASVFESILLTEDPHDRTAGLLAFFEQADPSLALGLHKILSEGPKELHVDETTEILFAHWWATADPKAAFQHSVNPAWIERHPWMRTVLGIWSRQDPAAAAFAVQTLPAGPANGRLEGARAVVDAWLGLEKMPDPQPLIGVIGQLEPLARGGAIEHLVSAMIRSRGLETALDFVRDVPPDEIIGSNLQHEFRARTVVALLDYDVEQATAWASEFKGTPSGPGIHKHLAYYWGLRDGQKAIAWAYSLSADAPKKAAIIKRAWLSFSRKQKDEAEIWLTSREPDPLMRGTYMPYLRTRAETDPEEALRIAERATNVELQNALRVAVGEGWVKKDPDAVLAWLTETDLPKDLEYKVRAAHANASRQRAREKRAAEVELKSRTPSS